MAKEPAKFDPYEVLQSLDRRRVTCIVIGGFARVIQGTEEITRGIDIVPSTRAENLQRLDMALRELGAKRVDGRELALDGAAVAEQPVNRAEHGSRRGEVGTRTGWHARPRQPPPGGQPRAARPRAATVRGLDR